MIEPSLRIFDDNLMEILVDGEIQLYPLSYIFMKKPPKVSFLTSIQKRLLERNGNVAIHNVALERGGHDRRPLTMSEVVNSGKDGRTAVTDK